MHMALSSVEWLSLNAQYCNRYHARISPATCAENRQTGDGSRCAGCDGLEDQAREPERPAPVLVYSKPEPEMRSIDPLTRALVAVLKEILDGDEWLDEEPVDGLDDDDLDGLETRSSSPVNSGTVELDPLKQLLLTKLQGYDQEDNSGPEKARVEIIEPPERKRRVKVYTGRCMKCRGYMTPDAKECHAGMTDDEVYRCYNCGWRTSPAYDYNRKHPGEGWR